MRCSKCGGEIRNLPDYMEEIDAEFLCTKCSGYSEQDGEMILPDRYKALTQLTQIADLDNAA
jgi:hypothetical protein